MKDKIGTLIILAVFGIALFSYDRQVVKEGRIGPIGLIAQRLGLEHKKGKPKVVKKGIELTFDFRVRGLYRNLDARLKQIDYEEKGLSENRNEILRRLIDINDEMADVVRGYVSKIDEKRRPFLEHEPEIVQLRKDLIEAHKMSNQDLKLERYRILEGQLKNEIGDGIEYENEDMGRLKNIIYGIEQIVMQSDDFYIGECDNYNQCLEKKRGNIDSQLTRIFEPVLKTSGRQMEKINELLELSEYEYFVQIDNLEAKIRNGKLKDQKIYASVQGIMNQFIRITPSDLKDMIYVFQDVHIQYRKLSKEFDSQIGRWDQNMEWNRKQFDETLEELKVSAEMDFDPLIQHFAELDKECFKVMEEFRLNNEQLKQIISHKLFENINFLRMMCEAMNVDVVRLVKDIPYAQGINNTYIEMRRRMKRVRK